MQHRHPKRPERIGEALDGVADGVVDEAVTVREVARVAHRDHGVVEQNDVALPADGERLSPRVDQRYDDERDVGQAPSPSGYGLDELQHAGGSYVVRSGERDGPGNG